MAVDPERAKTVDILRAIANISYTPQVIREIRRRALNGDRNALEMLKAHWAETHELKVVPDPLDKTKTRVEMLGDTGKSSIEESRIPWPQP